MAVVPLFAVDMPGLKAGLRLSGVPDGLDADKMIDDATESARTFFYRRLGATRVGELLAMTLTENPSTTNEILRAQARLTEVKVVRLDLMKRLRMCFIDSSTHIDQAWNTEGLLRDVSSSNYDTLMRWLWAEILEDLLFLGGTVAPQSGMNGTTFEPDPATLRIPGQTAFGNTYSDPETILSGTYWQ